MQTTAIIHRVHFLKAICFAVFAFLFLSNAGAATYYSKVTTGNFSTTSSWTADTVSNPNAPSLGNADIFIIRNGHTITLNGSRTLGQLIIRSGGTMAMSNNYTLTTSSPLTVNTGGTINILTRQFTVAGSWENNGSISITTGRLTCNTGSGVNNGNIAITSTGRIVRTTGSFENTGSVTMANGSFFTAGGGLFTNSGTFTVSGTATITLSTGNFVNTNTSDNVDFGSSAINISGTATNQQIGGFTTTGRFTCSKTSGNLTLTGNITAAGFTKSNSGTLNLGTGTAHVTTNNVSLSGGTVNGGSATLTVSFQSTTAWTGTGTVFVPENSTIIFNAGGNQTMSASGAKTFNNLVFSGSGTKAISTGTLAVNGELTMADNAITTSTPIYGASASLRYNTATARSTGTEWPAAFTGSGGVIIDNTGAISPNASKTFNEGVPLNIIAGATLTTGANNFSFAGDFINNGNWTASSGDITITGTVAQDIGSFTTSGTVHMTKTGGTAIMQGNMNTGNFTMNGDGGNFRLGGNNIHTITGTWTNTAGTLRCNTSTLNVDGVVSGTSITFMPNNGTVHFRGESSQAVPPFTFNNLEFSGAGLKTLSGNTTVNEVLTINSGSTLDANAFNLDLAGSGAPFIVDGNFTASNSTVLYSNAASTEIAALNYYNLNGDGGDRIFSIADTIGIAGAFVPGTGSYTIVNSIVDFNGDDTQDIPSFTFHGLIASNAGSKRILAAIIVNCQAFNVEDAASVEINGTGGGKLNVLDE